MDYPENSDQRFARLKANYETRLGNIEKRYLEVIQEIQEKQAANTLNSETLSFQISKSLNTEKEDQIQNLIEEISNLQSDLHTMRNNKEQTPSASKEQSAIKVKSEQRTPQCDHIQYTQEKDNKLYKEYMKLKEELDEIKVRCLTQHTKKPQNGTKENNGNTTNLKNTINKLNQECQDKDSMLLEKCKEIQNQQTIIDELKISIETLETENTNILQESQSTSENNNYMLIEANSKIAELQNTMNAQQIESQNKCQTYQQKISECEKQIRELTLSQNEIKNEYDKQMINYEKEHSQQIDNMKTKSYQDTERMVNEISIISEQSKKIEQKLKEQIDTLLNERTAIKSEAENRISKIKNQYEEELNQEKKKILQKYEEQLSNAREAYKDENKSKEIQHNNEINEVKLQSSILVQQIKQLQSENANYQIETQQHKANCEHLQQQINKNISHQNGIEQEKKQIEEQINTLTAQIDAQKIENFTLKNTLSEAMSTKSQDNANNAKLNQSLQTMQDKYNELEQAHKKATTENLSLTNKLTNITNQLSEQKNIFDKSRANTLRQSNEYQAMAKDNIDAIDYYKAQIKSLNEEVAYIKQTKQVELEEAEHQVSNSKAYHEKLLIELYSKIQLLEKSNSSLNQQNIQMNDTIQHYANQLTLNTEKETTQYANELKIKSDLEKYKAKYNALIATSQSKKLSIKALYTKLRTIKNEYIITAKFISKTISSMASHITSYYTKAIAQEHSNHTVQFEQYKQKLEQEYQIANKAKHSSDREQKISQSIDEVMTVKNKEVQKYQLLLSEEQAKQIELVKQNSILKNERHQQQLQASSLIQENAQLNNANKKLNVSITEYKMLMQEQSSKSKIDNNNKISQQAKDTHNKYSTELENIKSQVTHLQLYIHKEVLSIMQSMQAHITQDKEKQSTQQAKAEQQLNGAFRKINQLATLLSSYEHSINEANTSISSLNHSLIITKQNNKTKQSAHQQEINYLKALVSQLKKELLKSKKCDDDSIEYINKSCIDTDCKPSIMHNYKSLATKAKNSTSNASISKVNSIECQQISPYASLSNYDTFQPNRSLTYSQLQNK